jgi:hypothetical protein
VRTVIVVGVVSLSIGIAGCAGRRQGGEPRAKQTRPIVIVLHDKNGACQASFGKKPQHAYREDTVSWEFINTCGADQRVTLAVKSGSSNPFTDASGTWAIPTKANNESNPDSKDLEVNTSARGSYGFDITVGGKSYDPRLEIDP